MAMLKVTLKRGLTSANQRQRKTVSGLGLRKRHQTVVLEDSDAIRGMIEKVSHLVEVEEVENEHRSE